MTRTRSRLLGVGFLALVALVWVLGLRPTSLGGGTTYVAVRGSSMQPTYATGDLVIVRTADAYGVGDVVAYRVPDGELGEGRIVIHRIIGGDSNGFSLQGDNNDSPDPWLPSTADVVGRAWIAVPNLGRVLAYLHQPAVLAALAAAGVVMLLIARAPRVATEVSGAASRLGPATDDDSCGPKARAVARTIRPHRDPVPRRRRAGAGWR